MAGKAGEIAMEGADDAATDAQTQENLVDESIETRVEDQNARGEAGADETGGDENGEQADAEGGEQEGVAQPDERDKTITELRERLEKLEKVKETPEQKTQAPLSEDQKASLVERSGFTDFKSIEWVNDQLTNLGFAVKQYVDRALGELSRPSMLDSFSKQKGFEDASTYRQDIEQYLQKVSGNGAPSKEMLEMAYFYAKGRNSKTALTRTLASRERNRRIAGVARPASPNGQARAPGAKGVTLTTMQKEAAKAVGMPESEYVKYMQKKK